MTAITVAGLRYRWPGTGFEVSLDAFSVPQGALAGLVGPSGCGKSTLLALLSGELEAAAGRIEVAGLVLTDVSEPARRAHRLARIGMVLQDHPLVSSLDAEENVLLPYRLGLRGRGEARGRARGLLEDLGLGHALGRRPDALSQGERQRVAIARALVTEPVVVLADEPTSGLDDAARDRVVELLAATARERGMTLLMVTHDAALRDRFEPLLELG